MSFQEELIAHALEQWTWFGRDEDRDDKFIDADGDTTRNKTSNGVPDGWMVHIQNNIAIKTPLVASLPTSEARVG